MKHERVFRNFALVFACTLLLYLAAYHFVEHLRNRKGGWEVTFRCDAAGAPSLLVSQPHSGITNVSFLFPGQRCHTASITNTIVFDRPTTNVPFGRVVYFDTTFLPGSVVFDFFGHELELMPRVLVLNNREIPWQSGVTFELGARAEPDRP
jgi:hypothetical protein